MTRLLTDYASCVSTYTWRASDITIVLDDDETDDSIVTADIVTPAGTIEIMASFALDANTLTLNGLHIQRPAKDTGPFGRANLRRLVDAVLEAIDCDEIRIEGAPRTTGAGPGRRQILRFKRRVLP